MKVSQFKTPAIIAEASRLVFRGFAASGAAQPCVASGRMARVSRGRTASAIDLHRRAGNGSIRTKDATVTGFRPQDRATSLAVVKPLASVRRHRLCFGVSALRAGDGRFQFDLHHSTLRAGKPAFVEASAIRFQVAAVSS